MRDYAGGTSVSSEKSRAEIESTLRRFGAERFLSGWDQKTAHIAFGYRGRQIRLTLVLPDRKDFLRTARRNKARCTAAVDRAWEQAQRESWRCLALLVKAKLVAIEAGISSFENEFLAQTMLPEGITVSEWLQPQIRQMVVSGTMPKGLLPVGPEQKGETADECG